MKVTSVLLNIKEEDYDLYEEELARLGWERIGGQAVYRKKYGTTEAEVKEHIPTFSADVYLTVTARNEEGITFDTINQILKELQEADKTAD
ncbi:hypothetical protein GCM10007416_06160 [Kroppenstedtia guangzhouensis]|uniref:Uncharacterized protein n=1 Tax=Kroppenstedtia guangzhouensis TaxID=1274356 RepID=A0ABQ1G3R0_9BACL|nr:hypothetical protein [Kroppenstedtia guangzhouensis]GGA36054.1 hypothetical protein GCM10007416_06160 [Kroppenstedtia guangzhouensis]